MAIRQLESPKFKAVYAAGASSGTPGEALASGHVYVTVAGGTYDTVANRAQVWTDKEKTTEATRNAGSDNGAFSLDAAGEAELWFDDVVDIRVESSTNELQYTLEGVESSPTATITGNFNLVQNGSFEIDSDADGAPDSWTLATETSGTIAVDATSGGQTHGAQGLKFTGAGAGAGTATSTIFDVPDGGYVTTSWSFKQADAATGTYSVKLTWFDYNGDATGSPTTVWSSTSGAPTAWTTYKLSDAVPSGATQAKLILTGLENGGTDETGSCWFDNVEVAKDNTYYSSVDATSGTAPWNFTDIPESTKTIVLSFSATSTDGTAGMAIQLGSTADSGLKTSGYATFQLIYNSSPAISGTSSSSYIWYTPNRIAGQNYYGVVTLSLSDATTNRWTANGFMSSGVTTGVVGYNVSGTVALAGPVNQLSVLAGSDTIDNGTIGIVCYS